MAIKQYGLGIDQRKIPNLESNSADFRGNPRGLNKLINVRLTQDEYYINDRGWEPQRIYPDSYSYTGSEFYPIRHASYWSRKNGSEEYYFYEQEGNLTVDWGNGSRVDTRCIISSNRYIPQPSELGTQMTPVGGKYCIFSNGHDAPFKFKRASIVEVITPFSWYQKPSPPIVIPIYPGYRDLVSSTGEEDFGGDGLDTESTAQELPGTGPYGITEDAERGIIHYAYAYRYVSDTGSVSPLSGTATLSFNISGDGSAGRYIAHLRIPQGPNNTKAIDIFRTQQLSRADRNSGIAATQLFFLKREHSTSCEKFTDHTPDSQLIIPATAIVGDVIPIESKFNLQEVYDDRVWIAGGAMEGQVRYSVASMPETFERNNYFNYSGGNITALIPFAGSLLVFQERSIWMITKEDTYKSSKLTDSIGTKATNSIILIDGNRLAFLARDGIYQITLNGGSGNSPIFSIDKISSPIENIFNRLTLSAMPRATACYNPIEREAWWHFPVDGGVENTFGVVLHHNGEWTFRSDPESQTTKLMTFSSLLFDGRNTVIAPQPIDLATGDLITDETIIDDTNWANVGLHIWSATTKYGNKLTQGEQQESNYIFNHTTNEPEGSLLETIWITLGTEYYFKSIKSIQFLAMGVGHGSITPRFLIDFRDDSGTDLQVESKPQQSSFYLGSNNSDEVYATATQNPEGVWGTSKINEYRPIRLRWDFKPQLVSAIRFRFNTTNLFAINSFIIEYEITDTPVINTNSRRY